MVLPLVAGALGLTSAIGGMYEIGKAAENGKYWNDYFRNTHRRPRYGYRSGYYNYGYYAGGLGRIAGGFGAIPFGETVGSLSRSRSSPRAYGFYYGYEPYDGGYMYW